MANIFLSYARKDRAKAEWLAAELRQHGGWTVWWDRQIFLGGVFWRVIQRELDAAECVVVLWSKHSVESDWVVSEAREALRRNILIPVRIDEVRVPLEFSGLQTADLFGESIDEQLEECIRAITALVAPRQQQSSTEESPLNESPERNIKETEHRTTQSQNKFTYSFTIGAIAIIIVLASLAFQPIRGLLGNRFATATTLSTSTSPISTTLTTTSNTTTPISTAAPSGSQALVVPPTGATSSHAQVATPPRIRTHLISRQLEDPDHHERNYATTLQIDVPPNAVAKVTVGLQRFVEGAVLVTDESGALYQKWGTAAHHNLNLERKLLAGRTYYVSSWHKAVADKGENLPWLPSVQVLRRLDDAAQVTVFHQPANKQVDATIDVNIVGLVTQ